MIYGRAFIDFMKVNVQWKKKVYILVHNRSNRNNNFFYISFCFSCTERNFPISWNGVGTEMHFIVNLVKCAAIWDMQFVWICESTKFIFWSLIFFSLIIFYQNSEPKFSHSNEIDSAHCAVSMNFIFDARQKQLAN